MRLTEHEQRLLDDGIYTLDELREQREQRLRHNEGLMAMSPEMRQRLDHIAAEWRWLDERFYDLLSGQGPRLYIDEDGNVVHGDTVRDSAIAIAEVKALLLARHRERLDIWHTVQPRSADEREEIRLARLEHAREKATYRLCDWSFLHEEPYEPQPWDGDRGPVSDFPGQVTPPEHGGDS